jgi:signal transduction histidine kinase
VPLPPLAPHGGEPAHRYVCAGGRGAVAIGMPGPALPLHAPMLAAALVLGVLALCTLPVARSLARPLEELVAVVNVWGDGQLAVRTGMQRRDEFGVLARAFDLAGERLQALMRSERELLANISHELRTPLARLRLVVEIAREAPERTQGLLEEIGHDLQELERLVDDVLTGVRLDMGAATATGASLPLHLESLSLSEVLTQARERFLTTYPDRELTLDLEAGLPRVLGDRRLLRRLVDNLVDNARKYSAAPAPIRVRARVGSGGGVTVEVMDQGFGMDAAELQQLGSPFFRSARSRSQTQGTGLGFMLSRLIAKAHHGTLEAQSTPDVGTTMTFRLRAID